MINTSIFLEKFLQNYRFDMVKEYLKGDVLDFGGNQGELKRFVKGRYVVVNYDHSALENNRFDTIVALAVIEHMSIDDVFYVFRKFEKILNRYGRIFLTTPTRIAQPVLEFLAFLGFVDRDNIKEHKHYWTKNEIKKLAQETGFTIEKYKKFQVGFNQIVILKLQKDD